MRPVDLRPPQSSTWGEGGNSMQTHIDVARPAGGRTAGKSAMINCYAFGFVPPFAQGLVRDLRARWALEEAGLPYRVTLIGDGNGGITRDAYGKIHPFNQVPAIDDGDFTLFESGAI